MAHPNGFQGTMTALVTPMVGDAVDETALRRLVNDQIAGGIDVLVPCGTTGEGATLTAEESVRVVRACVEEAKGRVPVVAGAGSNATRQTIDNVRRAKEAGAQGVLIVTPYYNKPQQEGLYQHFAAVAREGGLPIIAYNVPGRTSVDMLPETVVRLAKVPGVVGIKEAHGTVTRIQDLLELLQGAPFDVLAGDDGLNLPTLTAGGDGCVSVAGNVAPVQVSAIWKKFRAGDLKGAQAAQLALGPLVRALFTEMNPAPAKAARALLGKSREDIRLPLVTVTAPTREKLRAALGGLGLTTS